ncbi:hypothetical protein EI94DRAFT_1706272 [Lactarius quietus]|nr:hypothetical protein EI94DRAFT_1706272 [Lactarius quietus]
MPVVLLLILLPMLVTVQRKTGCPYARSPMHRPLQEIAVPPAAKSLVALLTRQWMSNICRLLTSWLSATDANESPAHYILNGIQVVRLPSLRLPLLQLFLQHVDKFLSTQGTYQDLLGCHIRNLLHDMTLAGWTSPVRNVALLISSDSQAKDFRENMWRYNYPWGTSPSFWKPIAHTRTQAHVFPAVYL